MTAQEMLERFAVEIYQRPLAELRTPARIRDLSDPLCVAMLIIDFETEVQMNGILGFIGNSSGQYIPETIEALRIVDCGIEADVLSNIVEVIASHGMTYEAMQVDTSAHSEFAVTSFSKCHGHKWDAAANKAEEYCSSIGFDQVIRRLVAYVEGHKDVFEKALESSARA